MKYLFVALMLLFSIRPSFASEEDNLMQKANSLYQAGNYEQAAGLYQRILDNGYSSKELFYNLGNSYFKSGRLGYAILNYEKAQKLSPNDEDVAYNLRIANARTVDKIESMPKIFFIRWWEELLNFLPVNGWTIISYVIYLALLVIIGFYFFLRNPGIQKWILISGMGTAFVLILSILILVSKYNYDNGKESGVVVESAVTVKLSPDEHSGDAFIVHEGIKVSLEDRVDQWVKVRLADGKVGWLPASDMKKI